MTSLIFTKPWFNWPYIKWQSLLWIDLKYWKSKRSIVMLRARMESFRWMEADLNEGENRACLGNLSFLNWIQWDVRMVSRATWWKTLVIFFTLLPFLFLFSIMTDGDDKREQIEKASSSMRLLLSENLSWTSSPGQGDVGLSERPLYFGTLLVWFVKTSLPSKWKRHLRWM